MSNSLGRFLQKQQQQLPLQRSGTHALRRPGSLNFISRREREMVTGADTAPFVVMIFEWKRRKKVFFIFSTGRFCCAGE